MFSNTVFIFMLCVIASFIQRTTGFGFGIFIMTALPFLMPSYGEATTLSSLLALTTSFIVTIKMRKLITWKRLLPVLFSFTVFSALSIFTLHKVSDNKIRCILGVILILASLYFIFFSSKIKIKPTPAAQISIGSVSGIMGGFFSMQGPPAVLYFVSSEPDKDHYMAMVSAYLLIGNAAMTLFRAGNGFLTKTVLVDFLFCFFAVVIGTVIGRITFNHIPAKLFRKIIYAYIGVSGIIVLATSLL